MMTFIQTMINKFLVGLDLVDPCDQFKITKLKWKKIACIVNSSGHLVLLWNMAWPTKRNGEPCIWELQVHLNDYINEISTCNMEYWDLKLQEKIIMNLA